MGPELDRRRVRAAFDQAAERYDGAAHVQREIVERLLAAWIPRLAAPLQGRLIDAGCGTGQGARRLRAQWPELQVVGVDFAPAMLARARPALDAVLAADIEALPLPPASHDAWWSSLAVQWCELPHVLTEAARVLRPGGALALSTLGPGTFEELRTAFSQVDDRSHTLRFLDLDAVGQAAQAAGLRVLDLQRQRLTVHAPDLRTLLRQIKDVGAHVVGAGARQGLMGRRSWAALQAAYEAQRGPAGLPLSYEVLLLIAERPRA